MTGKSLLLMTRDFLLLVSFFGDVLQGYLMKYLRHKDDINFKKIFGGGGQGNNFNENKETYPYWTNIEKYSDGYRR
jgi:hypothetical protein